MSNLLIINSKLFIYCDDNSNVDSYYNINQYNLKSAYTNVSIEIYNLLYTD